MFRISFLILVLMSWTIFAQTEKKPQANLIDEFETATNGFVKMKMDSFFADLSSNPEAQGFIFNFGTDREIAKREKQLQSAIAFRKYDSSRLTIIRGNIREKIKTQFWIVPRGAEPPIPEKQK